MKKIILHVLTALLIVSCGYNKSEQMLYNYHQKDAAALNFDLADLDFKIEKIEKISDITAADSIKHVKKEFAGFWLDNPSQTLIDTLSFPFVKSVINEIIAQDEALYNQYQQAIATATQMSNYTAQLEYELKRDELENKIGSYKQSLSEIEILEKKFNQYSEKPDAILSAKYEAKYSSNNPMLSNTKQSFNKVYYTNVSQTEFIKAESVQVN